MALDFMPVSSEEIKQLGWEAPDFIIVTGDAYVDHPSFGSSIISRQLEAYGFRVAIIAQPDWKNSAEFKKLGRPRLAFLVTAGNLDSMVAHYTVAKKRRKTDAYSPGGRPGLRPDRAVTVYCRKIREAWPDIPIVIGGIEASLRRMAHFDYWNNRVQPSLLLDAGADLLVFGMGEKTILDIAEALHSGLSIKDLTYIRGTVYSSSFISQPEDTILLPSFEEVKTDRQSYAKSFMLQYRNSDPLRSKPLAEPYPQGYVIQNPPALPLTTEEIDMIYRLPFSRNYHPVYEKAGGVPAIGEIKFSLVSSRGCFGGCSFCSLHFHQGKHVQARSKEAIIEEARQLIKNDDFKGFIHDVGGPTANFRQQACSLQGKNGSCLDRECLYPEPCKNLRIDHSGYLTLLKELRELEGVKKVFIRSGIRFDYLLYDCDSSFFKELCEHHISGQLKVAPEHASPAVLSKMGKPDIKIYLDFKKKFKAYNKSLGKEQYLVPYFMSSHPGSDLDAAVDLALFIRRHEHNPEQVQDFYPTPGTLSTCMFYTNLDPRTMQPVYVAKTAHEKAMQRALIQFKYSKNYQLVLDALRQTGRTDLIGYGRRCLIKPPSRKKTTRNPGKKNKTGAQKNRV